MDEPLANLDVKLKRKILEHIKYQIILMITIFVSSIITVILTVFISNRFIFNKFHNLDGNIIRNRL